MIMLKSCDGEEFKVKKAVALEVPLIKQALEWGSLTKDVADKNSPAKEIPVSVTSKILAKVIEYCSYHADSSKTPCQLKQFDDEFVKLINDHETLLGIFHAADYLQVTGLLNLMCVALAFKIKGMKAVDICNMLNISDDILPAGEELVGDYPALAD